MSKPQFERRIPWVAFALSLLSMGVGHIYAGRITKGLVLYVAWFAVPALGIAAAVLPPSNVTLVAFLMLPTLSIFGLYIYAAWDAFRAARREETYCLQDFNRVGLYCLLIVVHLACPIPMLVGMRELVFEAYYIPTRSMSPTILKGDRLLANKFMARRRFPERGDLVVFRPPQGTSGQLFVKRVVALAGDTVSMAGHSLAINGRELQREPIPTATLGLTEPHVSGDASYEFNAGRRYMVSYSKNRDEDDEYSHFELTVPDRSIFVLGDNRDRSLDSRAFGVVSTGEVLGFVQYNYFPVASWRRFGKFQE